MFSIRRRGASLYWSWIDAFSPEIEVRPIQLPGRESRWGEPMFTRMEPLVQMLAHDLEPVFERPFSLFGHSMGAFVAFELARQLRREGGPLPTKLIVAAARAPQIPDPDQPLHEKPDAELLKEIRRLNGIPGPLLDNPDLLKLLLPVLRADLAVCETYSYKAEPPLSCALSAYGGSDDNTVPRPFLTGWRNQTVADFNIRIFPGDHFFLQTARHALFRVISEEFRIEGESMNPMLSGLRSQAEHTVAVVWREVLGATEIGLDDNIFDLGGNSLHVVQALGMLRDKLDVPLTVLDMFQHPTIRSLVHFLYPEPALARAGDTASDRATRQWKALEDRSKKLDQRQEKPPLMHEAALQGPAESVAIIGMRGRFPGADTLEQFWKNLCDGIESIVTFTDEELAAAGVDEATKRIPGFVPRGGPLSDIEYFDASFFGFSPRDAEVIDPQQRLFLECCWESLEVAGYNPDRYHGLIGVYGGSDQSSYVFQLYEHGAKYLGQPMASIGNDKDYLTTQVSYKLNLSGPSIAVQTACSTSLVAVALACQSLLTYQCDMALAGGVCVIVPQTRGYFYQPGGIVSPDGHCRTFDCGGTGNCRRQRRRCRRAEASVGSAG